MGETYDLSKIFERDEVILRGGKVLEVKHRQELSIVERRRLDVILKKVIASDTEANEEGKTEDELLAIAERGSQYLHELAGIVLPEPQELEDWECSAIFAFWMLRAQQGAGGAADPSPSTPRKRRPATRRKPSPARKAATKTRSRKKS